MASSDDRWLYPHEFLGPRLPYTREQLAVLAGDDPSDPFVMYVGSGGKVYRLDEAALIVQEHEMFRTWRVSDGDEPH